MPRAPNIVYGVKACSLVKWRSWGASATRALHAFWDVKEAVASQLPEVPSLAAANARWHRNILDSVRRGDAENAVVAMREQFTGIRTRLNLAPE